MILSTKKINKFQNLKGIRNALLLSGCFIYTHTSLLGAPDELAIGTFVPKVKVAEVRGLTLEKLAYGTGDGVNLLSVQKHPDFKGYYSLMENSREGKALEACLAHSHNIATQETTLIPTALLNKGKDGAFHTLHPADLVEVDKTGQIVRLIQSKRTVSVGDILDPKYKDMSLMTSRERIDSIKKEIEVASNSSMRRAINLSGDAAIFNCAIKSKKLITSMPDGASLPSLKQISEVARADTLQKFNEANAIAQTKLVNAGDAKPTSLKELEKDYLKSNPGAKTEALTGLVTKTGKIIFPMKVGAETALLTFIVDGGIAYYQFNKGDINLPDCNEKLMDAAFRSVAVGGATAITVLVACNPAGIVIIGVSAGAYAVSDIAIKKYHEVLDRSLLKPGDLEPFGFKDDHMGTLTPSGWRS